MTDQSPRNKQHVDSDDVRTIEQPGVRTSVWLLTLAMALVGVAVLVVLRPLFHHTEIAATEPSSSDLAARVPPPRPDAAAREAPRVAASQSDAPPPPNAESSGGRPARAPGPQQPAPAAASGAASGESSDADESANEPSGIAVFPPPGTKPIKRGLVVPEDFELPPGYVRHYQTTDNGHQLPPILMFHPDYQPLDAHGQPIPLPEDRVVPPEMAPEGMPVHPLDDPEKGVPDTGVPARARTSDH